MRITLNVYKVISTLVGISIIILIMIALPLNELHRVNAGWFPKGSDLQRFGDGINLYLGTAHGFVYIGFVAITFGLSRMARWPLGFTALAIVLGTVPILSFWAERRAIRYTDMILDLPDTPPAPAPAG